MPMTTPKIDKTLFFYQNWFHLQKKVFWPRFETEQLVDLTINYAQNILEEKINILEIGTGSGVIAISLALSNQNWKIDAVDIDVKAINLAKYNQKLLNVSSVHFWKSNLFTNVEKKYNLIIANLPYVEKGSKFIKQTIFKWDPYRAIFGGNKGWELIRRFLQQVQFYLKQSFLIALEIGFQQKGTIIKLIKQEVKNANIQVMKDFNQIDRFVFIYKLIKK